ncbi:MAG TPA: hypothetical protein VGH04_15155, partial [Gemmatimonadaceae bacterium]
VLASVALVGAEVAPVCTHVVPILNEIAMVAPQVPRFSFGGRGISRLRAGDSGDRDRHHRAEHGSLYAPDHVQLL